MVVVGGGGGGVEVVVLTEMVKVVIAVLVVNVVHPSGTQRTQVVSAKQLGAHTPSRRTFRGAVRVRRPPPFGPILERRCKKVVLKKKKKKKRNRHNT